MSIIPLTLVISLCLVFTFVLFFICEQKRRPFGSRERESLLPLADEMPRPARVLLPSAAPALVRRSVAARRGLRMDDPDVRIAR